MSEMEHTNAGMTAAVAGTRNYSHFEIVVRSTLYNVAFYINLIGVMLLLLPRLFGDRFAGMSVARAWGVSSLWLLERICHTHVEFRGLANIPVGGAIIAPKHQSILETFALTIHLPDFSYILKRELIWIPFFGWYLLAAEQTAIDRKSGRAAILQIVDAARAMFAKGRVLFIFPEGTRRPVDAPPAYKSGVGFIYEKNNVPCVPVALNSGLFWPRRRFLRMPGRCVIEFLPPIAPGMSRAAFTTMLEKQIEDATNALVEQARAESPWLARYRTSPPTDAS